jgi:threonine/homoserine/homoserine lactone efflux protein
MQKLIKIFLVGLIVSFLGSLPLGTLNIAAMQISVSDGYHAAIEFAIGTFIVEIIYVRISLLAIDKIRKQEKILKWLEWITLAIVVALAAASFAAALKADPGAKNIVLSNGLPRFILGVIMSALNPVQIPFWFGWSTVLFTKKILLPLKSHYNVYITGIGAGTFLASCIFIFGGPMIAAKLKASQQTLNWFIGAIFLLTAVIQVHKMYRKGKRVPAPHP